MKYSLIILMTWFFSLTAFADSISKFAAKNPNYNTGINQRVEIYSSGIGLHWIVKKQITDSDGAQLIPVTREAAAVLQNLDRTMSHSCVVINSTRVKEINSIEPERYYLLDIVCKVN